MSSRKENDDDILDSNSDDADQSKLSDEEREVDELEVEEEDDDFSNGSDDLFRPDDNDEYEKQSDESYEEENVRKTNKRKRDKKERNEKPLKKAKTSKDDDDLTVDEVKLFIQEGLLNPGPPPTEKKTSANAWKDEYGMRFLYWSSSENLLEHWYHCVICGWVHHVVLQGGTNSIKKHAEKHIYSAPKSHIVKLLEKAISFGSEHGSVSKRILEDHFPKSDKW